MVQWLKLCASNARGTGSIFVPGRCLGTKIPEYKLRGAGRKKKRKKTQQLDIKKIDYFLQVSIQILYSVIMVIMYFLLKKLTSILMGLKDVI